MASYKPMCTTAEQLSECLTCDPTNMPVIEGNLFQTHAPISQSDVTFLQGGVDPTGAQTGIDFFQDSGPTGPADTTNPLAASRDGGLVRAGLRFRTEFILDSICVKLHCEPQSWAIDGNQVFTQALIDAANEIPASPEENNWAIPLSSGAYLNRCNAQLECGSPIWRASHWALQSYRMSLQCPSSPRIHEIMKQRLVDLGNCCLGTEYEGFGTTRASEIDMVRKVNAKLRMLVQAAQCPILSNDTTQGVSTITNGILTNNQDLGYFVPFNVKENWNIASTANFAHKFVEAARMKVIESAFGSAVTSPNAYKWFRLAIPRVIGKDENIEITLTRDAGDNEFFQRMLRELSYQSCLAPIPSVSATGTTVISIGDGASYTSITDSRYVRIPAGLWRFGIALKGWLLDANLCGRIKDRINGMSLTDWRGTSEGAARAAFGTGLTRMAPGGNPLQSILTNCSPDNAPGAAGCACGS